MKDLAGTRRTPASPPAPRYDGPTPAWSGTPDGQLVWGWKRDTAGLGNKQIADLVKAGKMKPDEAWFRPTDAATGKPIWLSSARSRGTNSASDG